MNATENEAEVEKVLTELFRPLHSMVKVIRDRHKCSIPEAIQKFGGPGIEREYRRIVLEMHDEMFAADIGGESGEG